jgi:hypothetical protein
MKRERAAFEALISHKSHMLVPLDQDAKDHSKDVLSEDRSGLQAIVRKRQLTKGMEAVGKDDGKDVRAETYQAYASMKEDGAKKR